MLFRNIAKKHFLIVIILLAAGILRFWRLEELTTFSGDQGYDFLIVKRMIVDGKLTLLGPKIGPYNELGNLYLGPAYYYILAPALFFSKLDPVGPASETVVLSLLTVLVIYITGVKFLTKKIGLLAASLYSLNSFLIDQSRSPSNPHLIPFFAILYIFSFLMATKSKLKVWPVLIGLSVGTMFQLHYLSSVLILIYLILAIFTKTFKRTLLPTLISFLIAISPQILFELRHDFFVTNLLFKQLTYGGNIASFSSYFEKISISTKALINIFMGLNFTNLFILLAILIFCAFAAKIRTARLTILLCLLVIFGSIISSSAYSGPIGTHYFATAYPATAILISVSIISAFNILKNFLIRTVIILLVLQIFVINLENLNLNRQEGYTMPKGWNLKGVKKAARTISTDVKKQTKKFNIAATLDGDTRATPYRYLVEVYGQSPQGVEFYPLAENIYLVSRDDENTVKSYTVWEVSSFAPFDILDIWDIQNGIKLYKISKVKK